MLYTIKDIETLNVAVLRMKNYRNKLMKGVRLEEDEEKNLKLNLGVKRLKNSQDTLRLVDKWFDGAKMLYKRLKKKEEEEKK